MDMQCQIRIMQGRALHNTGRRLLGLAILTRPIDKTQAFLLFDSLNNQSTTHGPCTHDKNIHVTHCGSNGQCAGYCLQGVCGKCEAQPCIPWLEPRRHQISDVRAVDQSKPRYCFCPITSSNKPTNHNPHKACDWIDCRQQNSPN